MIVRPDAADTMSDTTIAIAGIVLLFVTVALAAMIATWKPVPRIVDRIIIPGDYEVIERKERRGWRVSWGTVLVWIVILAVCVWFASIAVARELYPGQWANASPERREWFRSLTIPDAWRQQHNIPYESCCDEGDRVRTQFRVGIPAPGSKYGADQWWFLDPLDGVWKPVPPDIILKDKRSIDGEGYLFRRKTDNMLLCFVPPSEGT